MSISNTITARSIAYLAYGIKSRSIAWILDADLRAFFDTISHDWLIRFVEHRIADKRIVRLIAKWLKAGARGGDVHVETPRGTPQEAVISPLLASIYLHYVYDFMAYRSFWRFWQVWSPATIRRPLNSHHPISAIALIVVRYADEHFRYNESLGNLTPAEVCFGRHQTILLERERIKRQTIAQRRLQRQMQAA